MALDLSRAPKHGDRNCDETCRESESQCPESHIGDSVDELFKFELGFVVVARLAVTILLENKSVPSPIESPCILVLRVLLLSCLVQRRFSSALRQLLDLHDSNACIIRALNSRRHGLFGNSGQDNQSLGCGICQIS